MSSPDARRSNSRGRSASMSDDNRRPRRSRTRSRSSSSMRERRDSDARDRGISHSRSRTASRQRSFTRSDSRGGRSTTSPAVRSSKIVIEKLTKNVREAHIHDIFGAYGRIENIEVPLQRPFMTNRGVAYVLYAQAEYAENAITCMDEAQLDGSQISVSVVLPRRRASPSPSPARPSFDRFSRREARPSNSNTSYRLPYTHPDPYASQGRGRYHRSPGAGYKRRGGDRGEFGQQRMRSYSRNRNPRSRSPRYDQMRSPGNDPNSPGRYRARSPGRERGRTAPRGRRDSHSSYSSRSRSQSRSHHRNRDR